MPSAALRTRSDPCNALRCPFGTVLSNSRHKNLGIREEVITAPRLPQRRSEGRARELGDTGAE